MKEPRLIIGLTVALLAAAPLAAQRPRPLSPLPGEGLGIAPFFDGWYQNSDGTVTFSFGFSNLNREAVDIPLGPDNVITPKEYDGKQPTSFPAATAAGGGDDGGAGRRERERGVFTVTAPAGFTGDVVWTLRHGGQTFKVPARAKTGAYQLRWPMAMGSVPPLLRFKPDGAPGRGPAGVQADRVSASAGKPLPITIWTVDDSVREKEPVSIKPRGRGEARGAINVTWYKHSGPGAVTFDPAKHAIAELQGSVTTSARFTQPGDYVIRVRADNFGRVDTSPGNQCCWTNGYVRVTVTP